MIYQRYMPRDELFCAQLEMLMQNGQLATVTMHLVGVLAAIAMFWPFMDITVILLWAAVFLIFLLIRSLMMSNALVERKYQSSPRQVYWQLLVGAAVTGLAWAGFYIYAAHVVPLTMQYIFLLLIIMIIAFSLGYSAAVREYFVVYLFSSLWPIAWWSLVHYEAHPYNLVIGLSLLAFCLLLLHVCNQTHKSFRNMISLTWEREQFAQELGDLTGSLRNRNRQLQGARKQLTALANVDELTGLGNRRMVNRILQEEINRARRTGMDLSVIMLDVDHFKNYNDTYGHPAGDEVLQKLAGIMQRASTRAGEIATRYGGEEFLLILPGASAESAMRTASHLRTMVEEERIPHGTSAVADYVTVSQGVITLRPEAGHDPGDIIKKADNALYDAKDSGRNAIVVG